jgi:chromosome segregation ATPase
MSDDDRQDHEAKADQLERELDEMQERSERLGEQIEDAGDEWERRKAVESLPSAPEEPGEDDGPEPEAAYPDKRPEDEDEG